MTALAGAPAKNFGWDTFVGILKRAFHLAELEMSHEEMSQKVWYALREKYGDPLDEYGASVPWLVSTFDDHVIVAKDNAYYWVTYAIDGDGNVTLGNAVEAKQGDWIPAETPAPPSSDAGGASMSQPVSAPAQPTATVEPNVTAAPLAPTNAPTATGNITVSVSNPLPFPVIDHNLPVDEQLRLAREQATAAALEQQRAFDAELARARAEAWEAAQQEMARKQRVAALSQKLTSGARQVPFTVQELDGILLKLSDTDRELIAPVLEKIHDVGLVEMRELGTNAPGRGHRPLPDFAKPLLHAFLAKGGKIEEFFTANPEMGSANQYDLYEFEKH